jgi:PAS domain S-box-containing protein
MELVTGLLSRQFVDRCQVYRRDLEVIASMPSVRRTVSARSAEDTAAFLNDMNNTFDVYDVFGSVAFVRAGERIPVYQRGNVDFLDEVRTVGYAEIAGYDFDARFVDAPGGVLSLVVRRSVYSYADSGKVAGSLYATVSLRDLMVSVIGGSDAIRQRGWSCLSGVKRGSSLAMFALEPDQKDMTYRILLDLPGNIPIMLAANGISAPYRGHDYRGVDVFAYSRDVRVFDDLHLALVVKADAALVWDPFVYPFAMRVLFAIMMLAVGVWLFTGSVKSLIDPLRALVAVAKRISKGEYTARAGVEGGVESKMIAETFNLMLDRIAASQTILEQTVRERTAELRDLSARQTALLASIPDIIMQVDRNFVYVLANDAGRAFFGDDVVGKDVRTFFVGEQTTFEDAKSLLNAETDLFVVESLQRRKDGEPRLLSWRCRPIIDENGTVVSVISTARDITDQHKAQECIAAQIDELRRWQDAIVGQEERIITLKGEINSLSRQLKRPEPYGRETEVAS